MLSPGIPALIVCVVGWGVSIAFGLLLAGWKAYPPERPLRALLFAHIPVSITFWSWALYHTLSGTFDGGVVTFFFASLAAAHGSMLQVHPPVAQLKRQRWLTGLCGGLVVINYLGGVGIAASRSLKYTMYIYFVVGAALWLLATTCILWLLTVRIREASSANASPLLTPTAEEANEASTR